MSETSTLKVGDAAPDFELAASPTGDPGPFKLSDHRGSTVVINFVPAAFSPVCSNQLPIIEEKLGSLEGAVAVAISTDNTWTLKAWREQAGVSYPVLSDFNPIGATADGVRRPAAGDEHGEPGGRRGRRGRERGAYRDGCTGRGAARLRPGHGLRLRLRPETRRASRCARLSGAPPWRAVEESAWVGFAEPSLRRARDWRRAEWGVSQF